MIFRDKPDDFNTSFKVVTCYIECNGKILIVKRSEKEVYPKQWCAPGGKIEPNENRRQAVVREIKEETGIELNKHKLKFLRTVFVKYPEVDFEFSMFKTELDNMPKKIELDEEQEEYVWVTPQEALSYDLVPDEAECIKLVYKI